MKIWWCVLKCAQTQQWNLPKRCWEWQHHTPPPKPHQITSAFAKNDSHESHINNSNKMENKRKQISHLFFFPSWSSANKWITWRHKETATSFSVNNIHTDSVPQWAVWEKTGTVTLIRCIWTHNKSVCTCWRWNHASQIFQPPKRYCGNSKGYKVRQRCSASEEQMLIQSHEDVV